MRTTFRTSGPVQSRLRMTRGRALAVLAVSLIALLGGTVALAATAAPATGQQAPAPPLPLPTGGTCTPDSSEPACHLPTATDTAPATGMPLPIPTAAPSVTCFPGSLQAECQQPSASPCTGAGCIPPLTAPPPTSAGPGAGQAGSGESGDADCGIAHVGGCISNAINAFFRGIVQDALNPLLDLLSQTLLTTPAPDSLPGIGELWDTSWQILLVCYTTLILIAGILVMSYETLQTRHTVKEIAPRIVVGFLAGALSLWVATQAIQIANALAQAILGGGLDAGAAGPTLRDLVLGSLIGGVWISLIGLFLAGMLLVLLVTYIVRVALTIILIAGAPIALMCHALPQTEGIARWWWKAFGGCLAIQVAQSLTLITAMKVFLAPGGFTVFGPTRSGLVNLLVALALIYILFKIPFWVLGSLRGGGRRSLLGSMVRGFIAYKTFGLLRGGGTPRPSPANGGNGPQGGGRGGVTGYARTTPDGQYVLPLPGLRRTRPVPRPRPAPDPRTRAAHGCQLALPLGDDWPENKPVLGRDGQYRLPLRADRVTRKPAASIHPEPAVGTRRGRQRAGQLELPFDPYKGNRSTRSGQYPLPLDGLRRTPRPPVIPPPTPARTRTGQLELPFDPYRGNRPLRSGQYPLPLDGLHRVPRAKPTPAPAPPHPARPPAGRQLRLPLDVPTPPRRPAPQQTKGE
ncbi:hypothetical protein [Amycolatopsis pigmentata]|uniref:TrbL/VirB6 plasmid conjugal transfer protein n=1 Tax=Amycolatopsis pigmentata TaxID=450801 RepID=A0ABW5FK77_9PSEU